MSDTNITMTVVEIMGHPDKPVSARCILSGCQDMTTNAAPQESSTVGESLQTSKATDGCPVSMSAPAVAAPHPVVAEMEAAYAFRQRMIARRDDHSDGESLWHGWALEEAFHAGAKYARETTDTTDAARYRFLQRTSCGNATGGKGSDEECYLSLNPRDMDAAIDAAIAAADRTDDKGGGAGAK